MSVENHFPLKCDHTEQNAWRGNSNVVKLERSTTYSSSGESTTSRKPGRMTKEYYAKASRIARQRKKEEIKKLESKEHELIFENSLLQTKIECLRQEVSFLESSVNSVYVVENKRRLEIDNKDLKDQVKRYRTLSKNLRYLVGCYNKVDRTYDFKTAVGENVNFTFDKILQLAHVSSSAVKLEMSPKMKSMKEVVDRIFNMFKAPRVGLPSFAKKIFARSGISNGMSIDMTLREDSFCLDNLRREVRYKLAENIEGESWFRCDVFDIPIPRSILSTIWEQINKPEITTQGAEQVSQFGPELKKEGLALGNDFRGLQEFGQLKSVKMTYEGEALGDKLKVEVVGLSAEHDADTTSTHGCYVSAVHKKQLDASFFPNTGDVESSEVDVFTSCFMPDPSYRISSESGESTSFIRGAFFRDGSVPGTTNFTFFVRFKQASAAPAGIAAKSKAGFNFMQFAKENFVPEILFGRAELFLRGCLLVFRENAVN